MDLQNLIIIKAPTNSHSMFSDRGLFTCFVVLSWTFFYFTAYGVCSMNGMQNSPDDDARASFGRSYNMDSSDTTVSDSSLGYGFPTTDNSFGNICPNTHSFCFPSMLSGFSHKEKIMKDSSLGESGSQYNSAFCVKLAQDNRQASNKSWSSDYGVFRLLNGRVVSCSLNFREKVNDVPSQQTEGGHKGDFSSCGGSLLKQKTTLFQSKNSEMSRSSSFDSSFSPNVWIGPTVMDWGQKYLYSSSQAVLTVVNTCNESILHLYEPFSTDFQFYPCNFSEVSLRPGESTLICFVFFPRCLGLSSAHLIMQTSSGGFIVEAKGYATESPFGIQSLSGLEISPGGRLNKNFSLFNPFEETLYVEEITAWISVSLGHNSVEAEAICSINDLEVLDTLLFPTVKDQLVVKSSQSDSPMVAIRPHRNWEIGPHSSETLTEIDITVGFEGKIFGVFCLHLLRSSEDMSDTIMFPIEAEVNGHSAYDTVGVFVSATLEGLAVCDSGKIAIAISLKNDAPYISRFVKVQTSVDMEIFRIKYMEGLLLFPGTVTQIGIIYCNNMHFDLHDLPSKVSNLLEKCKLLILTNDSTSPLIEIPCEDILYICFEHQRLSFVGIEDESKLIKSGSMTAGYVGGSIGLLPNVKVAGTADVDELVLGNWESQGTAGGMSVLDDHEVLFPIIQVGSYFARWVTVKNPSPHAVMMQLILNTGEIIDECRGLDDLLPPSSSGNLILDEGATPTKYGFSVPKSALTEAYVHPYDRVTLGPIIFYPSDRCGWSGSALIRNNLSGVEWMPLRGFGGLLSLVLLERSEHVQSVEFDPKVPKPLNFSLPFALHHMKDMTSACSQPLVKELYAKNTGDLPLEVTRIRVSGRECGLDGFKILSCRGFTLEPGESTKLLISYQTDFSAAIVHRDLELALATGIFLIPMKASFPHDMLSNCKKSIFWMRVKKSLLGLLLVACFFLMLCFIFSQITALGSLHYLCKSGDNLVQTTIRSAGKTSMLYHNRRKSKLSMSGKMNHLMEASPGSYSYDQNKQSELGISKHLMQNCENNKQISHLLDTPNERQLSSPAVQSSDPMKASQSGYLMVKIGKEKGRRRKRKNIGSKLTALSEVSSSQSGTSTPSSPLSPVASAATKCSLALSPDPEQPPEVLSSTTQVADCHSDNDQASIPASKANISQSLKSCSNMFCPQQSHSASRSAARVPVHIPHATSPFPGGPPPSSLGSNSTVNLHARAPGSELHNQKAVQAQGSGLADEYTYDIWGDHFSGLHLLVPKNVTSMKCSPPENNFDSFFARGPQTLVKNFQEG